MNKKFKNPTEEVAELLLINFEYEVADTIENIAHKLKTIGKINQNTYDYIEDNLEEISDFLTRNKYIFLTDEFEMQYALDDIGINIKREGSVVKYNEKELYKKKKKNIRELALAWAGIIGGIVAVLTLFYTIFSDNQKYKSIENIENTIDSLKVEINTLKNKK